MHLLGIITAWYYHRCLAFAQSKPGWLVNALWMSPIVLVWLSFTYAPPILTLLLIVIVLPVLCVPLMIASMNARKGK